MAGESPHALQNVGKAGLSVLAGRKEREKEERAAASKMMDKTDMTKVIDRLMKDNPSLSYRDAYEIFQAGRTNAELIARGLDAKEQDSGTRAEVARTARIKAYQEGMKAIEGSIVGIMGKSPSATPAQKQAYEDAKASLGPNPALEDGSQVVATAASASGWGVPQKQ